MEKKCKESLQIINNVLLMNNLNSFEMQHKVVLRTFHRMQIFHLPALTYIPYNYFINDIHDVTFILSRNWNRNNSIQSIPPSISRYSVSKQCQEHNYEKANVIHEQKKRTATNYFFSSFFTVIIILKSFLSPIITLSLNIF